MYAVFFSIRIVVYLCSGFLSCTWTDGIILEGISLEGISLEVIILEGFSLEVIILEGIILEGKWNRII